MPKLTKAKVRAAVKEMVRTLNKTHSTHNDWIDGVHEELDIWWSNNVGTGRLDQLMDAPESERDIQYLQDAVVIFQTAQEEGWGIESDSGLWEGLKPFPALMSQAFFTLSLAVAQHEPSELD